MKSTITHCLYEGYLVRLKDEISVIVSPNLREHFTHTQEHFFKQSVIRGTLPEIFIPVWCGIFVKIVQLVTESKLFNLANIFCHS